LTTSLSVTGTPFLHRMQAQACYCGEEICTGYIGGAKSSELAVDHEASDEESEDDEMVDANNDADETDTKVIVAN
jgi:hypothetical protein